jgi:chromosome segregation ATPase
MAKFEQKLQELGLQEAELSVACKNLINDYRESLELLPTLEAENEGGELDKDIEEAKEELDDLDNKIVKKIIWFNNNKDSIEERKENLSKRGRPKKNANAPANTNANATQPTPQTAPNQNIPPVATTTATEPKKKKGFGFGTFLLLVGGTILGVSLLNRNK